MSGGFNEARERLSCLDVGRRYGMDIDERGRAACPIHGGEHRNFSVRREYGHCFTCGGTADAIRLCQILTGAASPLDALKILDIDFRLCLTTGGIPAQGGRRGDERERLAAFRAWETAYRRELCAEYRELGRLMREYSPAAQGGAFTDEYRLLCNRLPIVEYHLEILENGGAGDIVWLYNQIKIAGADMVAS